jgi:predicted enzyme related to lactoylglutathione lyase
MPSTPKPGAVVFAKSLERVAKFYQQVLSLPVTRAEPQHVVLESDGFQLVVHAIPEHIASSITISVPPEAREETPIKLLFPVASIAGARSLAASLGGQVGPSQREWESHGVRACDGCDPEGNVFQLRQNVP